MNQKESQQIGILIGEMGSLKEQVSRLADNIQDLPCQEHSVRIKLLEKEHNNDDTERHLNKSIHGGIRAEILGGLIGAGATGLIAILTHWRGWW